MEQPRLADLGDGVGPLGVPTGVAQRLGPPERQAFRVQDRHGLRLRRPHELPQMGREAFVAHEHMGVVVAAVGAPRRPIDGPGYDLDALALVMPAISGGAETVGAGERDSGRSATRQGLDDLNEPLGPHQGAGDRAGHHEHPRRAGLVALRPAPRLAGPGANGTPGGALQRHDGS